MNIEKQKEHFKDHIATLRKYDNITILDFENPDSINYQIRFLFEEDRCVLHISGDLGSLTASNYNNMCYEQFEDFVYSPGYFESKVVCHSRDFYEYDFNKAKEDLEKRFKDYEIESPYEWKSDEEYREEKIEEILDDFYERTGLGSKAYEILSEIDPDCFEYITHIGEEKTEIIELYLLAFELAQEQLKERKN